MQSDPPACKLNTEPKVWAEKVEVLLVLRADEFPVASNKREIHAFYTFKREDARAPCERVSGAPSRLPAHEVILMRISMGLNLLRTRVQANVCCQGR